MLRRRRRRRRRRIMMMMMTLCSAAEVHVERYRRAMSGEGFAAMLASDVY
jgi:hypothetical protein